MQVFSTIITDLLKVKAIVQIHHEHSMIVSDRIKYIGYCWFVFKFVAIKRDMFQVQYIQFVLEKIQSTRNHLNK